MLVQLIDIEDLVILKIEQEQWTYKDLSEYLKKEFQTSGGLTYNQSKGFGTEKIFTKLPGQLIFR